MEKTCEEMNWTGKPELFALVAFQQGAIDASQLRKAIRLWLDSDQSDLEVVLVEGGFVSATVHKKMSLLIQNNRKFCDLQLAPPLEELNSPNIDPNKTVVSDELERKVRHRVDKSHSHSGEKGQGHRKRPSEPSSYYDSFHEQFTREEKFFPGLLRHFTNFKRKFKRNIYQIRQGSMALLENILDWFFAYYQSLILSTIGLIVIGASVYYVNRWLSTTDTQPLSVDSPTRQPVSSGSDSDSPPQNAENSRSSLPTPTLQAATAVKQPDNVPEVMVESSEASNPPLSQSVPSSVARVSTSDDKAKASIRQQQLAKVGQILTNNDPELAVSFLESTLENVKGDKQDLEEALVVSLLSAKDFDRAGEHLVQAQFLDCDSPSWDLLFTCWLLYAPEASRLSVAEKLASVAETVPFRDALQRAMVRINIRNGHEVLPEPQAAPARWFSDALFQSVAAHNAGNRQQAIEHLGQARQLFEVAWSSIDVSDPSQLAARVGRKMIDAALSNYAQVIAK